MKRVGIIALLVAIVLAGCSNSNNNDGGAYDADYDMATESKAEMGMPEGNFGYNEMDDAMVDMEYSEEYEATVTSGGVVETARKIIKTAYLSMETLDYDQAVLELKQQVAVYGGYIEVSNIGGSGIHSEKANRHAYFTVRIPEEGFQEFMLEVNTIGHVTSQQNNGQDITSSYYDTDTRVKTLEIQEERLLEILKKAEKIEDILALERELSSVRYDIERLTQNLRHWDQMISYATLNINIQEVYEITKEKKVPMTFSEKIKDGFNETIEDIKEGFEDLIVGMTSGSPYLIFILPGGLILVLVYKKVKRGYLASRKSNQESDEKDK